MRKCKCVFCEKELSGGWDTFGPIQSPRCATCWFQYGDGDGKDGEEKEDAPGVENLSAKQREMLGTTVPCARCQESGLIDNSPCWVCGGTGRRVYVVCKQCDGTGSVPHECDCDLCTEAEEPCGACKGGLALEPWNGKKPVTAAVARTVWVS